MPEPISVPFVGSSVPGRFTRQQPQRAVNMHPFLEQGGAKTPIAYYRDPGLRQLVVAGVGPCRSNGVRFQGSQYFVSGNEFVLIRRDGTFNSIGTLLTNSGRVSMAAGRNQIALVDGTTGYYWDGTTYSEITDPDFPDGATHIAELDGFFYAFPPDSEQIKRSELRDVTSWPAEFISAEVRADVNRALIANGTDLYVMGDESTEVFTTTANVDFPLERFENGVIPWGIVAPHSLASSPLGVYWLAQSERGELSVMQMVGLQAQAVSNRDIDRDLARFDVVEDALGWCHQQSGQWWYTLTLPTGDKTLMLDLESGLWHDRKSLGLGRHRANGHGYLDRRHVVGDFLTGDFYTLDSETFDDKGEEIECMLTSPVIHQSGRRLTFNKLRIDMEVGRASLGQSPGVALRFSDDGGNTWSAWVIESMGQVGESWRLVEFTRLGQSLGRIFQLRVTDAVDFAVLAAYAEVSST